MQKQGREVARKDLFQEREKSHWRMEHGEVGSQYIPVRKEAFL